jgi:hypothetical protein
MHESNKDSDDIKPLHRENQDRKEWNTFTGFFYITAV